MEKARSRQNVDWYSYFKSIREECPWSYAAYIKGKIDIIEYTGVRYTLGRYQARMYILNAPDETVAALAAGLDYDDKEYEWLYSHPGFGPYATPVSVLIQQDRKQLNQIREQQNASSQSN